jgi:predicted GH43/DUF377 family glycosyl hydrolase
VLPPAAPRAELDRFGAWRAAVVAGADGAARMWYAGFDGRASRILLARQRDDESWSRRGAVLCPGAAGARDAAGLCSPSVVQTTNGLVMAYSGSDGRLTQTHLATSPDGHTWQPLGPVDLPGSDASKLGATGPCLVAGRDRLLLYQAVEAGDGRRVITVASWVGGTTWSDHGPVLAPAVGEREVRSPRVLAEPDGWTMFLTATPLGAPSASEDPVGPDAGVPTIALATSADGFAWERSPHGIDRPDHHEPVVVSHPSAVRLVNGNLRLYYTARPRRETRSVGALWSTDIPAPLP